VIPRKKRKVRLHLKENAPSVEGFFTGFWAGHYTVELPALIASPDSRIELDSQRARIPKHQVILMEEL
jgi:hypothetical protein